MKFRLAKKSDAKELSLLHYKIKDLDGRGIFSQMGKGFLNKYYSIILNVPNEVVLCAYNESGIVGFASATLNVEKQFRNLRKNKFKLFLSSIPSILFNPNLFLELLNRYNSTKKVSENKYVISEGARGEYWVWDPDNDQSIYAPVLNNKHIEILHILGVKSYNFEVDSKNIGVYKFSLNNGATEVSREKLPDGRERIIMNYDVKNMFKIRKVNKKDRK